MPKLIGGPFNGRTLNRESKSIIVPQRISDGGPFWLEENEPYPAWIDEGGYLHVGFRPQYQNHYYELREDGCYHYQGVVR